MQDLPGFPEARTVETLHVLLARIQDFCRSSAEERVIAKYAKFFREGYDAYGLDFKHIPAEGSRVLDEYRESLGYRGFLDLGDMLMASGKYEDACFAVHFAKAFKEEFSRDTFERFGRWFDGKVVNWAISDGVCGDLLSDLLVRTIVQLDDFASWRDSPNKWKRRAVPVTMLILIRGRSDPGALLDFIEPMMMDRERVVHQGLGWFLRELWKRSPAEVEAFLLRWKDSAARLIFQYATEKMTSEEKARFRRVKAPR